ncbi:histidine phosphatase family protein [Sphingobium sp. AR-3-1]|uniref:Histidine phosphatase family protein n=1 Tax=Sphingobium psychrophilum TaxID=2728834 RepID=A0A7X9ZQT0_9SPHN|nr:histidine phosphatase family protein [Sphingobium psychrophilum]NML09280.1 histidine phosphatase family protein [Sphingobium psychrophilum]
MASTPSSRIGGFPARDERLDARGARDAACYRLPPKLAGRAFRSPSLAAAQTAQAIGVSATEEAALADRDVGRWSGRSIEDIVADEPAALSGWLADPTCAAADGEAMATVQRRIGAWIDRMATQAQPVCAITHPMTMRAAIAHTLGFPPATTLNIDITPLSCIRLSFNRIWRLQALETNRGAAPSAPDGGQV